MQMALRKSLESLKKEPSNSKRAAPASENLRAHSARLLAEARAERDIRTESKRTVQGSEDSRVADSSRLLEEVRAERRAVLAAAANHREAVASRDRAALELDQHRRAGLVPVVTVRPGGNSFMTMPVNPIQVRSSCNPPFSFDFSY